MAVIARMESSEQLGFSVRVGYRRALHESASGAVLYAFQPPDIQERWERLIDPPLPKAALEAFRVHTRAIAKRQVELTPSRFVAGITDIRSEEHTSELQSLMRISYAVFCLKKNSHKVTHNISYYPRIT